MEIVVGLLALLVLVGLPFASGLFLSLGAGRGWLRQLAVLAGGVAVLVAAAVVSLVTDCEDCTPEIGVWLAGYALVGWLVGVALALVVRLLVRRRPGRVATMLAVAFLVPVVVLVGAGRRSIELTRLGCPTQEDFERVQSVEDVVEAFQDSGMPLERILLPPATPPTGAGYHGAVAFRHETPGATLFLAVCRQRCSITRFRPQPGERWYIGLGPSNNVPVWVTQSKPGHGRRLLEAADQPLDEVRASSGRSSRDCS